MFKTCLQISLENDLMWLKTDLLHILAYMKYQLPQLTKEDLFELRLIYNELISNAVIHGNKGNDAKKINLIITIDSDAITSVVRDDGDGFDYTSLLEQSMCGAPFNEHGRGLRLVLSLADIIEWNDSGNEVTVCKMLKSPANTITPAIKSRKQLLIAAP